MKNLVPAIAALCIPFAVAAQNVTSGGAHGTGNGMVFRQSGVATSSSGPVLAQSTADRIASILDLTPQQKSQAQAILAAENSKLEAFEQEAAGSGQELTAEQMSSKQAQLEQESVAGIRSILTVAQAHTLDALAPDQVSQLFGSSSGMQVSVQQPADALCDSSGKCIARLISQ